MKKKLEKQSKKSLTEHEKAIYDLNIYIYNLFIDFYKEDVEE